MSDETGPFTDTDLDLTDTESVRRAATRILERSRKLPMGQEQADAAFAYSVMVLFAGHREMRERLQRVTGSTATT